MLYNLYIIYRTYQIILCFHGVYVAYSFICWTLGSLFYYPSIVYGYFYKPVPQICDKIKEK